MTKSNPVAIHGGMMQHGQLSIDPRKGAPKRTTIPAIAYGMRSRIAPSHEFLHGAPIDDEPNEKLSQNGKTVPVHNGMRTETPEHRGADYGPDGGSDILKTAGPGSWKSEPHGSARLPAKRG